MVGGGLPESKSGAGHGRNVDLGCRSTGAGRGGGADATAAAAGRAGRGRGRGRGADTGCSRTIALGKKRFKNQDLKSFFSRTSSSGSGSGSGPSTHESVCGVTTEGEGEVQRTNQNSVYVANSVEAQATLDVEDAQNSEVIKVFLPDVHLISDPIPNMDEPIPRWGRSRLDGNLITQEHHYRVDTYFAALDAIITELDHRFNEVSSELLVCISCLDPRERFSRFNIDKIARLTEIYDQDFSIVDRSLIRDQLETFILHVRRVDDFVACHDLGSLAIKMVETQIYLAFPLVYRLIELALLLPVATTSVERAFSSMNIIKTDLRNRMSDDWLNDLILCYIEKEIFRDLNYDNIKKTFQAMKQRKIQLPKPPRRPRRA